MEILLSNLWKKAINWQHLNQYHRQLANCKYLKTSISLMGNVNVILPTRHTTYKNLESLRLG